VLHLYGGTYTFSATSKGREEELEWLTTRFLVNLAATKDRLCTKTRT
jgi:hypothetical protein